MSAGASKQAFRRMCGATDYNSAFNTVKNYDDYPEYDEDSATYGHANNTPVLVAEKLLGLMEGNAETKFLLDICCGSGHFGTAMRNAGYRGKLHGMDGSKTMLELSNNKQIYDQLFHKVLLPESKAFRDFDLYDGVSCVGAFGYGHLHFNVIPDIINQLRPFGFFVFTFRKNPNLKRKEDFSAGLDRILEKLEDEEVIRKISEDYVKKFYNVGAGEDDIDGNIICYQKLS